MNERFVLALVAEIGIVAIALIYDAEYINTAIGLLAGLLGGYGVAKTANKENKKTG